MGRAELHVKLKRRLPEKRGAFSCEFGRSPLLVLSTMFPDRDTVCNKLKVFFLFMHCSDF